VIIEERRDCLMLADQLLGIHIQRGGGDPRLNGFPELLKHFVKKRPCFPHFPDLFGIFEIYHDLTPKTFRMSAYVSSIPC
jgi:hypothetical protein